MNNEKMLKEAEKYGIEYYKKGRILVWHDEYHIYGYEWDPEFMTFYVDGEAFAKFPINYYIDYMRLYQNPEKEEIKIKPEIDEALAAKKAAEEANK